MLPHVLIFLILCDQERNAMRTMMMIILGSCPPQMLAPHVERTLSQLIHAAVVSLHASDEQDAESRVAAIQALVEMCQRHHHHPHEDPRMMMMISSRVVDALLTCADEDYGMDERGDVGSWVRKEAMLGLSKLLVPPRRPSSFSSSLFSSWTPAVTMHVPGFGLGTLIEIRPLGSNVSLAYVQFTPPSLGFFYFGSTGVGIFNLKRLETVTKRNRSNVCHRHVDASTSLPAIASWLPPLPDRKDCLDKRTKRQSMGVKPMKPFESTRRAMDDIDDDVDMDVEAEPALVVRVAPALIYRFVRSR
jgi:hypothetical protein